ncbi:LysE/ArgO family amino acid transporter [Indiicoccus explosivorum]|uniref:LysE/ArgO family amino acid transporter n=1 Tax=Indiicoccus explosivorum TaxID=1917864 RepID=UPI000B447955|nr:LysE/ArgO family amino acid transporter [Indiicoccus explosivorum]
MDPLLHGIVLAFGLILPLGVQNVFVFNQGATHPAFTRALPAITTAAICDTLLISLAVTGVSVVVFTFDWLRTALFVAGFLFLTYMGWAMWRTAPETETIRETSRLSAKQQILFAASVSLLNPHAIMDTIGVIGTSSLVYSGEEKWMFTAAVIGVSWIWFLSLAAVGRKVGQFDTGGKLLKRINQLSALIVWAMALFILSQLFTYQ